MSRMDWKNAGRFGSDAEINRVHEGMAGYRSAFGDWMSYYHLDEKHSEVDEVYGEATGNGYAYFPEIRLPCMHVRHIRGENTNSASGFYHNDELTALINYKMFSQSGLPLADIRDGQYERDRVIYNGLVFRITKITIEGKIQQRPTVVTLEATEMKKDELVDQPFFAAYAGGNRPPEQTDI